MNQLINNTRYAFSSIPSVAQDQESLLSKILKRLKTISTNHHSKNNGRNQHQSFLQANLLDDLMGPEIRRTLR